MMTWGRQCWSELRASIRAHPIRTPLLLLWFLQGPLMALIVLPPWGDLAGMLRPRSAVERCVDQLAEYRVYLARTDSHYGLRWDANAKTWDGKYIEECLLRR